MKRLVWLLLCCLAFGQEIRRPGADIDPGNIALGCQAGSIQASATMPKSYDSAGLTTSSTLTATGTTSQTITKARSFINWQSTGNVYSTLLLNINATFGGNSGDAGAGACIKYSIDGGNTHTTVKCDNGSPLPKQIFTISLSPTQDLSKLRVSACSTGTKGNFNAQIAPGSDSVSISDIWTAGTNPTPATGNGSGAGQAHRGAVVSN